MISFFRGGGGGSTGSEGHLKLRGWGGGFSSLILEVRGEFVLFIEAYGMEALLHFLEGGGVLIDGGGGTHFQYIY